MSRDNVSEHNELVGRSAVELRRMIGTERKGRDDLEQLLQCSAQ